MNRSNVNGLFELLRIYFPNNKKLDSETLKSAWLLLLEPYSTDIVRKAVVDALRESTNLPDPQKIAVKCEAIEPAERPSPSIENQSDYVWMIPYIRKLAAAVTEQEADEIHAAGLLTWGEAEAKGADFREWNRGYRARFPVGSDG